MGQKLLIDTMPFHVQFVEGKDGGGKLIARGEYARFDKPTDNNRVYPVNVWKKNLGRLAEAINRRRVFGELDHPGDGKTKLQRVSHVTTQLRTNDDGTVFGESELLDTPNGRILKALFAANCEVGVSSRGFGSTKATNDGREVVGEDYKLLAFDFVADPATKTAYPGIFAEELEHIPEGDMGLTLERLKADYPGLVEEFKKQISQESDKKLLEATELSNNISEAVAAAEKRVEDRMKGKFTQDLLHEVEKMRTEAEEKVRGELTSDPDVAGAKVALEQVAQVLSPFFAPPEAAEMVKVKDEEITALKKQLAEKDLELHQSKTENDELAKVAKKAAYTLHLERKIKDLPEETAQMVQQLIGQVEEFDGVEEIDTKVEAIKTELERRSEDEANSAPREEVEERDRKIEGLEEENTNLRDAVTQLQEQSEKLIDESGKLALKVYIENRLTGHPEASRLRKVLEGADSEGEVDKIIKEHTLDERDADEMARIRARTARGRERDPAEDELGHRETSPGQITEDSESEIFGVSIQEIADISGVNSEVSQ